MTNSTTKAIVLAQAVDTDGRGLFPQPNTPLEVISKSVFAMQYDFSHLEGQDDKQKIAYIDNAMSVGDSSDPVKDTEYAAFVKQLTSHVSSQIDYAKNTILPVLKDYVALVSERMTLPTTIMSDFDVVVRELPAPMQNDGFKARIENRAENGLYANPEINLRLTKPEGPIVDKLMTGSIEYDTLVRQWATELGEETISRMWDDVFTDTGRASNLIDFFEQGRQGLDYALFVWFALNHYMGDIPEGTPYTLGNLKKYADQYLVAAAVAITRAYFIDESQVKANLLVLSSDKFENTITVNGSVYKAFLKAGGKNEALLGGLLGDNLAKTLGEIQDKADEYTANYERNEALAAVLRKNEAFTKFKEALIWSIGSLPHDSLSEVEKDAWTEMSITVDKIIQRAREVVDTLENREIEDVHGACLRVLVRSRYFYTDAEKFLASMAEATKANKTLDIREAGFVALIEKVGDYVADMIVVRQI